MDNQADYRRLAIQRSIEKARAEAGNTQVETVNVTATRQNNEKYSAEKSNSGKDENKVFNERNTGKYPANSMQLGALNQQSPQTKSSQSSHVNNQLQNQGSQLKLKNQETGGQPNQKQLQNKNQNISRNRSFEQKKAENNFVNTQVSEKKNDFSRNDFLKNSQNSAYDSQRKVATSSQITQNISTNHTSEKGNNSSMQKQYKEIKHLTVAKQEPVTTKVAAPKSSTIVGQQTLSERNTNKARDAKTLKNMIQDYDNIPSSKRLKVIFLGGVGEIGKNMTLFEYDGQILVLDCGVSFPGGDMPGVDLVIPDFTYLKENASKVVGYVITHGHEDHIGGLPFVLKDIKAPIYSGRLTLALLENKLKEHQIKNVHMEAVETRREYRIGKFFVEFVDVNHSIADALAIKITTQAGVVFHTGDFKVDFQPIDGKVIDLPRIAEIGRAGVDLLLCESTNVEHEGYTLSESVVGENLAEVFEENRERRLFVATFSSNIYRVQQIINLAIKYNRKVSIIGRSMMNNLEASIKIGKLNFPKELFVDIEKVNKYEDKDILILCTGSQGEANAALSRLASGEFGKIEIGKKDTVIFSSSPIPGNESSVNKVINNLYKKGALVVHENVHASGHACVEELKTMHSLIKPKFFVPVHGEYRHLKKHAWLAESMGTKPENILIADLGDVVELTPNQAKLVGKVQAGETLVDGSGLGDLTSSVIKERKMLSEEGLAIVVIGINKTTSTLVAEPIVITRGFVYDAEEEELIKEAKQLVVETLESVLKTKMIDWEEAKQLVRKPLRNYFFKKTKRSPIILPVIYKI